MYYYFSADFTAAIKFNGVYFGLIEKSVKACNLESESSLVEITPVGKNLPARAFILNDEFLSNPPDGILITDLKGGYLIKLTSVEGSGEFCVVAQEKFSDLVVTVFNENGYKLSLETPSDFFAETLPFSVTAAEITRLNLGGENLVAVRFFGQSVVLSVYSFSGKITKVYSSGANAVSFDNGLRTTENLIDMAKHVITTEWGYSGGRLTPLSRKVSCSPAFDRDKLNPKLIPYAFCEEFLCRGEYTYYLTGNVKEKADRLFGYLGNFIGVMPPPLFRSYAEVGLIYSTGKNKYSTDYFIFDVDENKKIFNVKKTP